jgi:tetratricopeptide (TPR) repeat protein
LHAESLLSCRLAEAEEFGDADSHYNLALAHEDLDQYDKAVLSWQRAEALAPNDTDIQDQHDQCKAKLQESQNAEECWESGAPTLYLQAEQCLLGREYRKVWDRYTISLIESQRKHQPMESLLMANEPPNPLHTVIAPFKLRHDAAQFRYLLEQHVLPSNTTISTELADLYERIADAVETGDVELPHETRQLHTDSGTALSLARVVALWEEDWAALKPTYNVPLHVAEQQTIEEWSHKNALNPHLDFIEIQRKYFEKGALHVDGLLTPEALQELRRFLFETTGVFSAVKEGYLGAYQDAGFIPNVLLRLVEELETKMPFVFSPKEHALNMW